MHLLLGIRRYHHLFIVAGFSVSACTQAPVGTRADRGLAFQKNDIAAAVDADGVTTGEVAGLASTTQVLTADPSANLGGSSVSFPPGALAVQGLTSLKISIQEGSQLASSLTAQEMGLTSSFTNTGKPVVFTPSVPVNAASPFTIAIPIPNSTGLALQDDSAKRLVVIYRTYDANLQKYFTGMFPPNELELDKTSGQVKVKTRYFGAFQAAYVDQPVTEAKRVETTTAIQTKVQEKTLPPLELRLMSAREIKAGGELILTFANLRPTFSLQHEDKVIPDVIRLDDQRVSVRVPSDARSGPVQIKAIQESVTIPIDLVILNGNMSSSMAPIFTFYNSDRDIIRSREGSVFRINWRLDDYDGNAKVTFYYRPGAAVASCSDLNGWTAINATPFSTNTYNYNWNMQSLSPGAYAFCAKVEDNSYPTQFIPWPRRIIADIPPTITVKSQTSYAFQAANSPMNVIWESTSLSPTTAQIRVYLENFSSPCGQQSVTSDRQIATTSLLIGQKNWTPVSTIGTFRVCAVITDEFGWSAASSTAGVQISSDLAAPNLLITNPTGNFVKWNPGQTYSVTWISAGSIAPQIELHLEPSMSGSCSGGTTIATDVTTNNMTLSWTVPSNFVSGTYMLCAKELSGALTAFYAPLSAILVQRNCDWLGGTSTSWVDPLNWDNCNDVFPTPFDRVYIEGNRTYSPQISSPVTIAGFADGVGGGTIQLANSSSTISIRAYDAHIGSSVTIEGQAACAGCNIYIDNTAMIGPPMPLQVAQDAILTIGNFVKLDVPEILVGGNGQSGSLRMIGSGVTESEWPKMGNGVIRVEGTSAKKSSLTLKNVVKEASLAWEGQIQLKKNATMDQLQGVKLVRSMGENYSLTDYFYGARLLSIENCEGVQITNKAWSDLRFDVATGEVVRNPGCTFAQPIVLSGSGLGFPRYPSDPAAFTWTSPPSRTCVWQGTTSNDWGVASNWSQCTGTPSVPGPDDFVSIPATATRQPQITATSYIRGFAGVGGGTIAIAEGYYLRVMGLYDAVRSSVAIKGVDGASRCYNCGLIVSGGFSVSENSTLSLGEKAMVWLAAGDSYINFGNGGSAGNLTVSSGNDSVVESDFAIIRQINYTVNNYTSGPGLQLWINGAMNTPSTVSINGLSLPSSGSSISFNGSFNITRLDRLIFGSSGSYNNGNMPMISLQNCNPNIVVANQWNNLAFNVYTLTASMRNVALQNCPLTSSIKITALNNQMSNLFGASYEADPNSKIDWVMPP